MGHHGPDKPRVDAKERRVTGAVQEVEQNLSLMGPEQGKERGGRTFALAEAAGGVGTVVAWLAAAG